jgi:hypothetical protein
LSHQVKKNNGDGNQFVDDKPFINERKPSSTTFAKGKFNNGERTLIPVMAKTIHSAVSKCQRLVLKDGQLLHMVKFVGAVRNFSVNNKYVKNRCGRWHRTCAGNSLEERKRIHGTALVDSRM